MYSGHRPSGLHGSPSAGTSLHAPATHALLAQAGSELHGVPGAASGSQVPPSPQVRPDGQYPTVSSPHFSPSPGTGRQVPEPLHSAPSSHAISRVGSQASPTPPPLAGMQVPFGQ